MFANRERVSVATCYTSCEGCIVVRSSMSSSSIPIPIAMHSSSTVSASVTVTQMRTIQTANFKPLSHRLGRGLPLIQLHRRLNYGASFRCSAASSGGGDGDAIVLHVGVSVCVCVCENETSSKIHYLL